jgi:acid stress chaperone HdeB
LIAALIGPAPLAAEPGARLRLLPVVADDCDQERWRNAMVKLLVVAAMGSIFALELASEARAQVALDLSKVTCDQFVGYKITNPQNIVIWLSGYYNGKRGNTVIDPQGLDDNAKKLRDFCFRNPSTPVMQATETLFDIKHD